MTSVETLYSLIYQPLKGFDLKLVAGIVELHKELIDLPAPIGYLNDEHYDNFMEITAICSQYIRLCTTLGVPLQKPAPIYRLNGHYFIDIGRVVGVAITSN